MERPKFVFEEEDQQESVPQITNNVNPTNFNSTNQKPTVGLKYSKLEDHKGSNKKANASETLAKNIEDIGKYGEKINHLEDAKGMKPNLFFREDNQSPIPENNRNLTLIPEFKPTQFDPYKYLGSSRTSKKDYKIFLETKAKRKKNKNQTEQKFNQSNNSSQVVLDIPEIKDVDEVIQQPQNLQQNNQQKILLQVHPLNGFKIYSFTIQKKLGVNYMYPQYKIWSNDKDILISAKKQAFHINSYYNIFAGDIKTEKKIGFLQGNFGGTEFNIYQSHQSSNQLLATVVYKAQVSCNAFRKVQIYVKDQNTDSKDLEKQGENLKDLYESGITDKIIKIITKQPVWREDLQSYIMNFKGKSKMSSTKNMILINQKNQLRNSLLFCKRQYNKFYLQISHPFNLLISMGILLSSFDFKLLCQ